MKTNYIGRLFVLAMMAAFLATNAKSQGFPWKGDGRTPYIIPDLYFGGGVAYSSISPLGDYSIENEGIAYTGYKPELNSSIGVNLSAEYWYLPDFAISINAGITRRLLNINSEFSEAVLVNQQSQMWDQESNIEYSSSNFLLSAGAKKRIFGYLSLAAGIGTELALAQQTEHRLLSLDENLLFNGTDKEIVISGSSIDQKSSFNLLLNLGLNFDLPLSKNLYLSSLLGYQVISNTSYDYPLENGIILQFTLYYGYSD